MKLSVLFSVVLLALALTGCKAGGEAAVIGKWKSEAKVDTTKVSDPALAQGMQSLAGIGSMDVEFKSDHKYKMTLMGFIPIEGDWSMSGSQVTCTPKTIAGMTVEDAVKMAEQKKPGSMAMAGPNPQTQAMVLDLQSDGKTMKLVKNSSNLASSGMEMIFNKQ